MTKPEWINRVALHRERLIETLRQHEWTPDYDNWPAGKCSCGTSYSRTLGPREHLADAVLATAVDLIPVVAAITKARQDYISDRLAERLKIQGCTASSHEVQVWTDTARSTWNDRYPALRDLAGGER